MTYSDLVLKLLQLNREQLDSNITIEVDGEFIPASLTLIDEDGALDDGHPVIAEGEHSPLIDELPSINHLITFIEEMRISLLFDDHDVEDQSLVMAVSFLQLAACELKRGKQ